MVHNKLIEGVRDIKEHRYMATVSFSNILAKKVQAPFKPVLKGEDDTSNFGKY